MDYLDRYHFLELRSVEDWGQAISKNIAADHMLDWFGSVLDELFETKQFKPWTFNQWCAAQHRFRELAHFSKKLTPQQRQTFINQADSILELIRDFYGKEKEAMARLDAALSADADYNLRFGWPSPAWKVLSFEEL